MLAQEQLVALLLEMRGLLAETEDCIKVFSREHEQVFKEYHSEFPSKMHWQSNGVDDRLPIEKHLDNLEHLGDCHCIFTWDRFREMVEINRKLLVLSRALVKHEQTNFNELSA